MTAFLLSLFSIICILLIIVVLIQKGRGGGLGSAFGGMGSTAFGTKVGDVLTWVTIILTGLFLLFAIITTVAIRPERQQVAMPVFNPQPMQAQQEVSVEIACPAQDTEIHYTLDGSDPQRDSAKYENSPVAVFDQTLKARAFKRGMKASEVTSGYYGPKAVIMPTTTTAPADEMIMPETMPADVEAADEDAALLEEAATAPAAE